MVSRFDPPTGNVPWRDEAYAGGWRRKGRKVKQEKQRDLPAEGVDQRGATRDTVGRAGVTAPLVARKGRNGPGAKGAQEGGWEVSDPRRGHRGKCLRAKHPGTYVTSVTGLRPDDPLTEHVDDLSLQVPGSSLPGLNGWSLLRRAPVRIGQSSPR